MNTSCLNVPGTRIPGYVNNGYMSPEIINTTLEQHEAREVIIKGNNKYFRNICHTLGKYVVTCIVITKYRVQGTGYHHTLNAREECLMSFTVHPLSDPK